jgi:hypothetical protein
MKRFLLIYAGALLISVGAAVADPNSEEFGDNDLTPIETCENLPKTASIEVFTPRETAATCKEMLRIMEGITIADIRSFSKAAYVLSRSGYQEGNYSQIVRELVDIIRLRGLFNSRPRWYKTNDFVVRCWTAFHGIVSPKDIQAFLISAGPDAAKSLSDDGFQNMVFVLKELRQRGDD